MAVAELDRGMSLKSLSGTDRRLATEYQDRQFNNENESIKQPQRLRVLDHITKHHGDGPMRLFSLPGVYWEFEKQVDERWRHNVQFVACDWSYGIIERGAGHMPGVGRSKFNMQFNRGTVSGFRTQRSIWVWSSAASFFHIGRSDMRTKHSHSQWVKLFKRTTAAWLDFTSPLCTETVDAMARFGANVSAQCKSAPVAITVMMAREPSGFRLPEAATPLERRVRAVELAMNLNRFRSFEVTDFWKYESHGGVPMAVVCGLSKPTSVRQSF